VITRERSWEMLALLTRAGIEVDDLLGLDLVEAFRRISARLVAAGCQDIPDDGDLVDTAIAKIRAWVEARGL
jgi:hypothetical protein